MLAGGFSRNKPEELQPQAIWGIKLLEAYSLLADLREGQKSHVDTSPERFRPFSL